MKKFLTGLMIATTLVSGAGATSAMAAPRHDDRPAYGQVHRGPAQHVQVQRGRQVVRVTHVQQQRTHRWHQGQRMTRADRSRYVVNDWRRAGLRAPGRGQQWVRENNNSGDYILVAIASGLIASIIAR